MGKEYRGGQLIYEGGFKVALWSGMGKNYVNGKLIFEGEYLGGQKMEKGKNMMKKEEFSLKENF